MEQRPTKKQRELLSFIDGFIKGYGYGPSYREIMNGLGYQSVSTVAVHIDGLIARGYLRKRDNSARSNVGQAPPSSTCPRSPTRPPGKASCGACAHSGASRASAVSRVAARTIAPNCAPGCVACGGYCRLATRYPAMRRTG